MNLVVFPIVFVGGEAWRLTQVEAGRKLGRWNFSPNFDLRRALLLLSVMEIEVFLRCCL